jgi:hypothetical protein
VLWAVITTHLLEISRLASGTSLMTRQVSGTFLCFTENANWSRDSHRDQTKRDYANVRRRFEKRRQQALGH